MYDEKKQDENKKNGQSDFDRELEKILPIILGFGLLVCSFAFLYPSMIVAGGFTITFFIIKKWKFIKWFLIGGGLGLAVSVLMGGARVIFQFPSFFTSYRWYINLVNKGEPLKVDFWSVTSAIFLGIALGSIATFYLKKYMDNHITIEKEQQKKNKLEKSQVANNPKYRKKVLSNIQNKYRLEENSTDILLGVNSSKKAVVIDYKDFFKHTLVQGTTGSGKTYLMYNILEGCLKIGLPSVFIDGKGDPKTEEEIKKLAKAYGKNIYVFSDRSDTKYNPLKNGKPTAIKDRLMATMDWSEQFYEKEAGNTLQMIITMLADYGLPINLKNIHKFLSLKEIFKFLSLKEKQHTVEDIKIAEGENYNYEVKEGTETINAEVVEGKHEKYIQFFFKVSALLTLESADNIEKQFREKTKLIKGLNTQLEMILYSDLGELFSGDEGTGKNLDLKRIIERGDIALFSFNSNDYGDFIESLGRIVIADLAHLVTTLYNEKDEKYKGIIGFFDEFGSYGTSKIIDILAKARSANFGAVLGVQSLFDLNAKTEDMTERVIDNVNMFLFGRSNSPESAEKVANVIGTYEDIDRTTVTENIGGAFTRIETKGQKGTVRNVHKYYFSPDTIKNLEDYTFIMSKKINIDDNSKQKVYIRNMFEGLE